MNSLSTQTPVPGKLLKIRFNTKHNGSLHWRIIIDEKEYLADHVTINVPAFDTEDVLPDGTKKYHISCYYNQLEWIGGNLVIN